MGFKLVRKMRQRKLPPNEMAVWTVLGDHASDIDGTEAFPSQATIARESGYTERRVREILHMLERRGAIVETTPPGRRTTRHYRVVLEAVPVVGGNLRPEIFSGLDLSRADRTEIKTGNPCNQDRKFEHQDRKSDPVRPEKISGKPSDNSSGNPEEENPQTRARETIPPDPESIKKEENTFRKGRDDIDLKISVITNDEVIRKRSEKKAELEKQKAALEIVDGLSRVIPANGKYD